MAIHSETHDFKATLSRIAEIASCSAGWRWVAITRFLNKKGDVKVIGWWDKLGNYEQLDYNILGTPCQAVVNSEKLCFYQNVQEDFPNEPAFSKLNASSYMGITYRLNELSAGHIFFMHDKYVSESKRYFSEMLLKLISLFVGSQLELIDTQKQLGKAINEANRDALTNLYNRRAFDNDIQQAEQHYKDRFITDALLVFIDVNGMKTVNDKRGHNAGDHLLITIASLLTKIFRQEDKCYRFGGDEFAVLITGRTLEAAESLASRLAFLNTQLGDAGFEEASVCYGHCFLKDVQGDATTWLKTTDERLYTAKALWRTQQRATPVAQTE